MTRVKLGGRELTIADELVTEYLAKGYSVIDEHGRPVASGRAPSYASLVEEINSLKEENARIRSSNEMLEAQRNEAEKKLGEALGKLKKLEQKAAKSTK